MEYKDKKQRLVVTTLKFRVKLKEKSCIGITQENLMKF